jgi:hypothetical protein
VLPSGEPIEHTHVVISNSLKTPEVGVDESRSTVFVSENTEEAMLGVGDVTATRGWSIDKLFQSRPYTALAVAAGPGLLSGARWRLKAEQVATKAGALCSIPG